MFQGSGSDTQVFDAVVVGSGATGGWAAKVLTEGGLKVAMLEAGPKITQRDFTEHRQAWQYPFLGQNPRMREWIGGRGGGSVAIGLSQRCTDDLAAEAVGENVEIVRSLLTEKIGERLGRGGHLFAATRIRTGGKPGIG